MPIGGLERYSGLQGGGYVQLDGNQQIRQVGDTPFFGKIVKWHVNNLSRTDANQQTTNRTVRQDFFIALQQSNREIAKKYAEELVGQGNESRPLSARRVREIMTELKGADPQRRDSVNEIMEIAIKFPERQLDLPELYQNVIAVQWQRVGTPREVAIRQLAEHLAGKYETLSETDKTKFKHTLGEPEHLETFIKSALEAIKPPNPTQTQLVDREQPPLVISKNQERRPNFDMEVGKPSLKQTEQPEPVPRERDFALAWLSEAQDKALDSLPSGQHFPREITEALEEFNRSLPEGQQIQIQDVIDHPGLDMEMRVMQSIKHQSTNGWVPLMDDGLHRAIAVGVEEALGLTEARRRDRFGNSVPLGRELLDLKNDDTLSPKAKAEAARRLIHELGRELNNIRKGDGDRQAQYENLFSENRALCRQLHPIPDEPGPL